MSAAEPNQSDGLEVLMRRALALARNGWGDTHPNPMVGALIVEGGEVVAEGWHSRDGGPHAERVALEALGRKPRAGAELVVTLEPCSTHGRTGACTDAILAAGIRRVVVGATDPNPDHSGRGLALLREAGVDVVSGVLGEECADLNLIFNHWIATGAPLIAGKVATTLDGRTATRTGASRWITGEAARADVHRWRRLFPAIAVGAQTVLADNPRLTARMEASGGRAAEWCPVRIVFDGGLRTAADAVLPGVYSDEFARRTVVAAGAAADPERAKRLRDAGVEVWFDDGEPGRFSAAALRLHCARRRIPGVLVEGGGRLLGGLLAEKGLDYLFAYRAPVIFADEDSVPAFAGLAPADPAQAPRLCDLRHSILGDDTLVRGRVVQQ